MTLVVLLTGFSNFACIFWLQNTEWVSSECGAVICCCYVFSDYNGEDNFFLHPPPFFASLYVFSDYKRVDSILCCIRQHHAFVPFRACLFWRHFVASATIISFYVCLFWLQNVISALVCLFWSQKRGRQFVASVTFLVCLFWLQKTKWSKEV